MFNDFGVACRRILRSKASAFAIFFLIVLAVSANSCVFSVWYGLLFKPLPYPAQERLVSLNVHSAKMGMDLGWSVPYLDFIAHRTETLEDIAAYRESDVAISDENGKYVGATRAISVQPKVFSLLGARAALGRLLYPSDAREGSSPAAVISWSLWQSKFGGSSDVLKKSIRIGKSRYQITGVLQEGFWFPRSDIQVWLPLVFSSDDRAVSNAGSFGSVQAIGLENRTASVGSVTAEMTGLAHGEPTLAAITEQIQLEISAQPLRYVWVGQREKALQSMLLAVLMVLLVATANICSLFILRLLKRRQESALFEAFGADELSKARQLIFEIALLVVTGVAVALLLQPVGFALLRHFDVLPAGVPQSIGFDSATLLAACGMSAFIFMATLISALCLSRQNIYDVLRQTGSGQTASQGAKTVRQGLVVLQVAITIVLLFGTSLLVRSAHQLLNQEIGFDRSNQLVGTLRPFDGATEQDTDRQRAALAVWMSNVAVMPGIDAVALSTSSPFGEIVSVEAFRRPGIRLAPQDSGASAYISFITPKYFTALGLPIRRGRGFTEQEAATDAPVGVIDETLAGQYFQTSDPLGKTITVNDGSGGVSDLTIVGVVASARQRSLTNSDEYPTIYRPSIMPYNVHGIPVDGAEVIVRTKSPETVATSLKAKLEALAPSLRFTSLVTMKERVAGTVSDRLRLVYLLEIFAAVATVLTSFGLYALLSYVSMMRMREFGIRKALGAGGADVSKQVFFQGAKLIAIAIVLAVPTAIWLGLKIAPSLYHVAPFDPISALGVLLSIGVVGLIANVGPAYRASKANPMDSLRTD